MEDLTIPPNLQIAEKAFVTDKPYLRCPKCTAAFHYRIRRNWFLKYVLFFLPVKIYFCAHCVKKRYVLLSDRGETRYKPV
ncbi:hypothetical protein [Mucilaginibacter gotjawali]|uniref:Nucleic acid-binding Zn ribbon protein n=2 Tax=Mucilaginibacter gotjawali TaxID=1550579 RepID=A0A839SGT7_9SPHI|nr:hypothetical protein [Mucilaginibacter gotjawali]MBB3056513.1 putative nucleic acid-binding Zn ribbon protein [Mucilaginibacter gotjawali]BAU52786.1 hypothetical protein MgSA37_00949 [Mucilaginibacter gotjawali]